MTNLLLDTDSYKHSHAKQYPPGTRHVFSYLEARGGEYPDTLFFGLQMILKEKFMRPITLENILEAEAVVTAHGLPFNKDGWMYILKMHRGMLPILIKAVPEGSVVPTGNVLMTVVNTDPEVPWLTNFIETMLMRVWYPTTVATASFHLKKLLRGYVEKTSDIDPKEALRFMLHDFGARGCSGTEESGIGGMSHLVNFYGTDTLQGLVYARKYYNGDVAEGYSIPAAEHSTITSWGRDNEKKAFENMVNLYAGEGKAYSVVSDSYDIYNAVRMWGEDLKDKVIASKGRLVIRPDSGNPVKIVPQIMTQLMSSYGCYENSKGYKVLPDCVRVIQGDGVNPESIKRIMDALVERKMSSDNIVFGMGGALLRKHDRDTLSFAMKCSAINKNRLWYDVYKSPVTDGGLNKASKRGRLTLINDGDGYKTIRIDELPTGWTDKRIELLNVVFENGILCRDVSFNDVRTKVPL